jgi:hypothetical protein
VDDSDQSKPALNATARAIGRQLHLIATAKAYFDTASGCSTQFQKLPLNASPTDWHSSFSSALSSFAFAVAASVFFAASD